MAVQWRGGPNLERAMPAGTEEAESGGPAATRLFVGFVLVHTATWTLLPALLTSNAMLDPIEGLAWGHEWQLGYHKGPPLWSWAMELIATVFGQRLWPMDLASQVCLAVTFFAVWQLGRRVVGERDALLGVLLLEGVYYFAYPTPEFNEIIMLMPFAGLLGWGLHRALHGGGLLDWAMAGFVAGAGLWVRYAMGAYIVALALFMLLHPVARRHLARPGPYVATFVAVAVFAPHAAWIVESDFVSLSYVAARAGDALTIVGALQSVLHFCAAQLLALSPLLLILLLTRYSPSMLRPRMHVAGPFDRAYVAALALGPCVVTIMIALSSGHGLRSMWGGPLWCFIGLFAVVQCRLRLGSFRQDRLLALLWLLAFLLPVGSFAAVHCVGAVLTKREKKAHFPGAALARDITAEWRQLTGRSLRYVAGSTWLAGNVAFYSPDRPSVFTDGNSVYSPWVDHRELICAGAVLVWNLDREGDPMPERLRFAFPNAERRPSMTLKGRQEEHRIGWAVAWPSPDNCPGNGNAAR